jgi:thiol-disulfide isomerase/thioredoxin
MLLTNLSLTAQSFYVLTDVKSYEPLVITEGKELEVFNKDIKSLMQGNALELDVNTTGHSSRVLAFIINKFSLGETIGVRVILELGEYVRRKGSEDEVFAISYVKQKIFVYNKEELEDDLADAVEEMLEIFATQYIDDNKKLSDKKKTVTHETFDKDMDYENDYKVALAKAKKEGKKLMVFMTTAYCPWCRKLESRILAQEHIDKKIKATHIPVMLNFDEKKFPKVLGEIPITPTLYVVNAKTEKIEETFIGFSSRNMFLNYLNTLLQKHKKY